MRRTRDRKRKKLIRGQNKIATKRGRALEWLRDNLRGLQRLGLCNLFDDFLNDHSVMMATLARVHLDVEGAGDGRHCEGSSLVGDLDGALLGLHFLDTFAYP